MKRPCIDRLPDGAPCPNLTDATRCAAHEAARLRRIDTRRGSTTDRGYGAAWQRISAAQIARQPWCADCGHTGSPDNPLTADHVIPKAAGGTDDPSNLTTRCRRHNSAKRDRC